MTLEAVAAGTTLYVEGMPATRVIYVVAGFVGLWRGAEEERGAGVPGLTRRAGGLLGSEGLAQQEYADTAITLTDVTICTAERQRVWCWATEGTVEAARAVMEVLIRTQCSEQPRASSAEGTASRRIARWLADESRGGVGPPIPRAVIAGLLGMLPETFSRGLATLSARGAIAVNRKEIRVIDPERLLREAGG